MFRGHRAIVVGDVFVLVLSTCNEGRVEEGSGLGVRWKRTVHLRVFRQLSGRENWSTRGSSLWDVGIDGVTMSCRCRRGVVGNGVEVDHGISGNHVMLLWVDVLRGSSFEVLSFLVPFWIMSRVVRRRGLEGGWEGVGFPRLGGTRCGWCGHRSLGGDSGGWCGVGDGELGGS